MKQHLLVFALLLVGLLSSPALAQNRPEMQISSQDIIKLVSQSKGKVVVVNFWASWCGPCRQEIPDLIAVRKKFPEDKLLLVGVSIDQDPAMFTMFAAKAGFNFPVYLAKPDVPPAFSIRAIPRTVVYSPKGEMVKSHDGMIDGAELEDLIKKHLGS